MKPNTVRLLLGFLTITAVQLACVVPATDEGQIIPPAQYGEWIASRSNQTVPTPGVPVDVFTLLKNACIANDSTVEVREGERVSSQDFTLKLDGSDNLNFGENQTTLPDGRLSYTSPDGLTAVTLGTVDEGTHALGVTAERNCDHPSSLPPLAPRPQQEASLGFSPRLGKPAMASYGGFGRRK